MSLLFNVLNIALIAGAFLVSLGFHEAAHAFVAYRLGDPTAKIEGRLTLNPFAHIDIFGALAIFIVNFGWGKPVPVNPAFFSNPRRDNALVALAGPSTNLVLCTIGIFLFGALQTFLPVLSGGALHKFLLVFITINASLAFFNLIPLPPLDGGSVLLGILPESLVPTVSDFLGRHGVVLFFSLLAVDLFLDIHIITGPVIFLTDLFIVRVGLLFSPMFPL
ncbi:site-2 protease family protein [Candidatus Peregrinibacteria bacterium]|nr:MAG: site-2 protease family protein [Candidatus Peregrinibacteria bacterium]